MAMLLGIDDFFSWDPCHQNFALGGDPETLWVVGRVVWPHSAKNNAQCVYGCECIGDAVCPKFGIKLAEFGQILTLSSSMTPYLLPLIFMQRGKIWWIKGPATANTSQTTAKGLGCQHLFSNLSLLGGPTLSPFLRWDWAGGSIRRPKKEGTVFL